MYKRQLFITLGIILLLVAIVSAAYKADIYDYTGNNLYSKIDYVILGAENVTASGYFLGDGSLLTGVATSWIYGDYFDQNLNTTNEVTFSNVSASNYFIGDGSLLTGINAFTYSDYFDQSLNTTSEVTFGNLTLGTGTSGFAIDIGANMDFLSYNGGGVRFNDTVVILNEIQFANGGKIYDNSTCLIGETPGGIIIKLGCDLE